MSQERTNPRAEVSNNIEKRWSPRAFSEARVEHDKLKACLEAARWAPSSYNEQPWRYIVVTKDNKDAFEKALACLIEINQKWCKKVPVILFAIRKSTFTLDGRENRHAQHDVGGANALMACEAANQGLQVHQMAGFSPTKVRETFGVPEGFEPTTAIALGYQDGPETLDEDFVEMEKTPRDRKEFSEFVFSEKWDVGLSFED